MWVHHDCPPSFKPSGDSDEEVMGGNTAVIKCLYCRRNSNQLQLLAAKESIYSLKTATTANSSSPTVAELSCCQQLKAVKVLSCYHEHLQPADSTGDVWPHKRSKNVCALLLTAQDRSAKCILEQFPSSLSAGSFLCPLHKYCSRIQVTASFCVPYDSLHAFCLDPKLPVLGDVVYGQE